MKRQKFAPPNPIPTGSMSTQSRSFRKGRSFLSILLVLMSALLVLIPFTTFAEEDDPPVVTLCGTKSVKGANAPAGVEFTFTMTQVADDKGTPYTAGAPITGTASVTTDVIGPKDYPFTLVIRKALSVGTYYFKVEETSTGGAGWSSETPAQIIPIHVKEDKNTNVTPNVTKLLYLVNYPEHDAYAWEEPSLNHPFGSANYYGVFSLGNMLVGDSDCEGGVAVKGNFTEKAYSVSKQVGYAVGIPNRAWNFYAWPLRAYSPRFLVKGNVNLERGLSCVGGTANVSQSSTISWILSGSEPFVWEYLPADTTNPWFTYVATQQESVASGLGFGSSPARSTAWIKANRSVADATLNKFFGDAETSLKALSQSYKNAVGGDRTLVLDATQTGVAAGTKYTINPAALATAQGKTPAAWSKIDTVVVNFPLANHGGNYLNIDYHFPDKFYGRIVVNFLNAAGTTTLSPTGNTGIYVNGTQQPGTQYALASNFSDRIILNFPNENLASITQRAQSIGCILAPYTNFSLFDGKNVNGDIVCKNYTTLGTVANSTESKGNEQHNCTPGNNYYGHLTFTNTYASVQFTGVKTANASFADDQFTFSVYQITQPEYEAGNGTFAKTTKAASGSAQSDGTILFDEITYKSGDLGKTFYYAIVEDAVAAPWTGDSTVQYRKVVAGESLSKTSETQSSITETYYYATRKGVVFYDENGSFTSLHMIQQVSKPGSGSSTPSYLDGSVEVPAYCAHLGEAYVEGEFMQGHPYYGLREDKTISDDTMAKIRWLVSHSYPNVDAKTVLANLNINLPSGYTPDADFNNGHGSVGVLTQAEGDVFVATQFLIWVLVEDDGGTWSVQGCNDTVVNAVYNALEAGCKNITAANYPIYSKEPMVRAIADITNSPISGGNYQVPVSVIQTNAGEEDVPVIKPGDQVTYKVSAAPTNTSVQFAGGTTTITKNFSGEGSGAVLSVPAGYAGKITLEVSVANADASSNGYYTYETEIGTNGYPETNQELVLIGEVLSKPIASLEFNCAEIQTPVTFNNTFAADASIQFTGTKTADAEFANDIFTFSVYEITEAQYTAKATDFPTTAADKKATGKAKSNGNIVFDPISYTEAGTHYYAIVEDAPAAGSGWNGDNTIYYRKVVVSEDGDGNLTAADQTVTVSYPAEPTYPTPAAASFDPSLTYTYQSPNFVPAGLSDSIIYNIGGYIAEETAWFHQFRARNGATTYTFMCGDMDLPDPSGNFTFKSDKSNSVSALCYAFADPQCMLTLDEINNLFGYTGESDCPKFTVGSRTTVMQSALWIYEATLKNRIAQVVTPLRNELRDNHPAVWAQYNSTKTILDKMMIMYEAGKTPSITASYDEATGKISFTRANYPDWNVITDTKLTWDTPATGTLTVTKDGDPIASGEAISETDDIRVTYTGTDLVVFRIGDTGTRYLKPGSIKGSLMKSSAPGTQDIVIGSAEFVPVYDYVVLNGVDNIVFNNTTKITPVYDAALRKWVSKVERDGTQVGSTYTEPATPEETPTVVVKVGDEVTFAIKVFNQGNQAVTLTSISDYVPAGYTFSETGNTGWEETSPGLLTYSTPITLAPGEDDTLELVLTVNSSAAYGNLTNAAEISGMTDTSGGDVTDIDSEPDTNPGNDTVKDNIINEDGKESKDNDEDDHDTAPVVLEKIYDAALRKWVSKVTRGGTQVGSTYAEPATPAQTPTVPVKVDDEVTFAIKVFNQGSETVKLTSISDYMPAGYTFSETGNTGWEETSPGLLTYSTPITLTPGGNQTIYVILTVKAGATNATLLNAAEISGMTDTSDNPVTDIDSDPDANSVNDTVKDNIIDENGKANKVNDEDDHDTAPVVLEKIYDAALRKWVSKVTRGGTQVGSDYPEPTTPTETPTVTVKVGDKVTFAIRLFNQCDETVKLTSISDYMPAGYTFSETGNTGWEGTSPGLLTYSTPITLAPNGSHTIYVELTVKSGATDATLLNAAEISGMTDTSDRPVTDIDSAPDANSGNDTVKDNIIDENGKSNKANDEDDHDTAPVVLEKIYDAALRKWVSKVTRGGTQIGAYTEPTIPSETPDVPVRIGDKVTFSIKVFNQGNQAVKLTSVSDYMPAGYDFVADDNSTDWSFAGGILTYSKVIPLQPGADSTIAVILTVKAGATNATLLNAAEISGMTDTSDNPVTDIDSDPDATPDNDTVKDNIIDENGKSSKTNDEDDHDTAPVELEKLYDAALRKWVSRVTRGGTQVGDVYSEPTTTTSPTVLVKVGDKVTFSIKVFNQGNQAVKLTSISDYMPAGYTFTESENPGWTLTSANLLTYDTPISLLPGATDTITVILTVKEGATNLTLLNAAEISGMTDTSNNPVTDIDSEPDDEPDNDTVKDNIIDEDGKSDKTKDEDDQDIAPVVLETDDPVYDAALRKWVSKVERGSETIGTYLEPTTTSSPTVQVKKGDKVTFSIRVFNQGNQAVILTKISDYMPAGYTFTESDNPGWTLTSANLLSYNTPITLTAGNSQIITLTLTVNSSATSNNLTNTAEISDMTDEDNVPVTDIDSTPDTTPDNDTVKDNIINEDGKGSKDNDEDDHDIAPVKLTDPVYDAALRKWVSKVVRNGLTVNSYNDPGATATAAVPVEKGDKVTFSIKLFNQGDETVILTSISDYMPAGYDFSITDNAGWTKTTSSLLTYSTPITLAPGADKTIALVLTVKSSATKSTLTNNAEISGMTDTDGNKVTDIDSAPDANPDNDKCKDNIINEDGKANKANDEDDHDVAEVTLKGSSDENDNSSGGGNQGGSSDDGKDISGSSGKGASDDDDDTNGGNNKGNSDDDDNGIPTTSAPLMFGGFMLAVGLLATSAIALAKRRKKA